MNPFFPFFRPSLLAFLLFLTLSLTSCGGGNGAPTVALSNMVPVRLAMHLPGQAIAQNGILDEMLDLAVPNANAVVNLAGTGVSSVTITISGNGFTTIVDTFPAGAPGTTLTRQYNVPQGANRSFSVQGFNAPVGALAATPIISGTTIVPQLAPSVTPVVVNVALTPTVDVVAPVITAPAPFTVAAVDATGTPKTNAAIAAFLAGATATDNVDANPVVTNNAPVQFPLGPTTVTFTSTDAAGNVSTPVPVIVTVADQSAPVISLLGGNPISSIQGNVFVDPGSNVTDNVDVGLVAQVTGALNTAVLGRYILTYNVSDNAGFAAIPVTRTVIIAPAGTTHVWIGTNSTAWNVPANWDVGSVPGAGSSVFIPAFPVNQPIVTAATSIARLNNQAGTVLTLQANLTVANGFTNKGSITFNTTALTFTITSGVLTNTGAISNNGINSTIVGSVTNTGTIIVNQPMTLAPGLGSTSTIDLTAGTVNVATGMTLSCDTGTTTLIDAVGSKWTGTGRVWFAVSTTVTLTGNVVHPAGTGGTIFEFDTTTFNGTGTLTNNGTMTATNTTFTTLVNHGTLRWGGSDVQGSFTSSPGSSIINGDLTLSGGVNMNGVTIDNSLIFINTTAPVIFDNITFQNYAPTATLLMLNTSNATQTYNNLNFNSPLTTGFHIGGIGTGNSITIASTNLITGATAPAFDAANTVVWPNRVPAPTAPAITTANITAGTSQVTSNDPNTGDTHTYAVSTQGAKGVATVSIAGLATYTPNAGSIGADSFVVTVTDQGGLAGTTTISVTIAATAAQGWQTLKNGGASATTTAASQFQSAMAFNPADFEAVIGFCGSQTADLMSNPAFRSLLTTWTTDAGATLPTAAALAMNVANRTKTTINWVKKFNQLAVNGATVQANGFSNVLPVLNTCITNLEGVLAVGFVSQSVQNPASWTRFPSGAVTVDVADVNLLLSILYGARSEIYWLDAYNWNTDVDADGIADTVMTSAVIGATTYQYSTMNIDPKSVLADPTFFTLRTAGALLSTGAADLTQSLADAVAGISKRKAGLTTFNANQARAGNSANLFYYAPINLSNLPQDLKDSTNILTALDGTGYTDPLFKQRDGTTATATIRADLAYTGTTAWDRAVMPFTTMAYDVAPDPVASKINNAPTYYDERVLGNPVNPLNPVKVHANIYYGAYPDVTMKGVLAGGATLDKQDQLSRPSSTFVMNIAGIPIVPNRSFVDVTGSHVVSWLLATEGTGLLALKVDQNITMGNFAYTPYSVNLTTGALTLPVNVVGPVTLPGWIRGSGTILGSNAFFPGSSGATTGFWNLGIGAIVPTVAPAGVFGSLNVLRAAGTATGLVHWYQGNFFTGAQFATVSQVSTGGTATVREQYRFGLGFNASPVGTDATLGWLIFDANRNRLMRVVTGAAPRSAKVYYSPMLTGGGGQGPYHLVAGKFLDSTNLPVVHSYPLPALASFPATATTDVFP